MAAHDTGPILAILDPQWRPRHLVPLQQDWRIILRRLLRDDGSWVALVQRRPDDCSPLPCPADIALTRAINRRLRAFDIHLADHLILSGEARFSFRAAGLL